MTSRTQGGGGAGLHVGSAVTRNVRRGRRFISGVAVISALVAGVAQLGAQTPVGTAFTYQGRLTDAGSTANGAYDLQFLLYDSSTGAGQVGSAVTLGSVPVSGGVFSVLIDFGASAFTGSARWLELGVRPGGTGGAYTTIAPRQPLTPSPYALDAQRLGGKLPANYVLQTDVIGVPNGGTGATSAASAVSAWNCALAPLGSPSSWKACPPDR